MPISNLWLDSKRSKITKLLLTSNIDFWCNVHWYVGEWDHQTNKKMRCLFELVNRSEEDKIEAALKTKHVWFLIVQIDAEVNSRVYALISDCMLLQYQSFYSWNFHEKNYNCTRSITFWVKYEATWCARLKFQHNFYLLIKSCFPYSLFFYVL